MKNITIGENQVFFSLLRDAPFYQPSTNLYAIALKDHSGEKTVLVRDVSSSPKAYQQFFVTGSTTADDLSNAVVMLPPYGTRYYTVYPVTGGTLNDVDVNTVLAKGMIHYKAS